MLKIAVMVAEVLLLGGVSAEELPPSDGFSPFIALIFLVMVMIFCILVGFGMVLGLVFVGVSAAMVGFGIIASSALVGMQTRKPGAAVNALILQIFGGSGLVLGLGIGLAIHFFSDVELTALVLGGIGGLAGTAGGLAVALTFNALWPRWLHFLKSRFEQ